MPPELFLHSLQALVVFIQLFQLRSLALREPPTPSSRYCNLQMFSFSAEARSKMFPTSTLFHLLSSSFTVLSFSLSSLVYQWSASSSAVQPPSESSKNRMASVHYCPPHWSSAVEVCDHSPHVPDGKFQLQEFSLSHRMLQSPLSNLSHFRARRCCTLHHVNGGPEKPISISELVLTNSLKFRSDQTQLRLQ